MEAEKKHEGIVNNFLDNVETLMVPIGNKVLV